MSYNNIWNEFNSYRNSPSSNSSPSNNKHHYEHEFNMKQGLENHYSLPNQEEAKVAQYVQNIHQEMYPLSNTRPTNWINAVVGTYKSIRRRRVLEFRKLKGSNYKTPPGKGMLSKKNHEARQKEYKAAMKGLRMHIVVGCILRCLLVQDKVGVPSRILLRCMNNALKHYKTKKEQTPITLEEFEKYRYDSRSKGIREALSKEVPRCYEQMEPDSQVSFTGYSILRLQRPDVMRAIRLARNIQPEIPDHIPSGDIAIGALFTVLVSLNRHRDSIVSYLAMTHPALTSLYARFKNSSNPLVQRDLQSSISPSRLFKSPKKPKASLKLR